VERLIRRIDHDLTSLSNFTMSLAIWPWIVLVIKKGGQKSQLSLFLDPPESMISCHCTIYRGPAPILFPVSPARLLGHFPPPFFLPVVPRASRCLAMECIAGRQVHYLLVLI
jgi:hypothetical protein